MAGGSLLTSPKTTETVDDSHSDYSGSPKKKTSKPEGQTQKKCLHVYYLSGVWGFSENLGPFKKVSLIFRNL